MLYWKIYIFNNKNSAYQEFPLWIKNIYEGIKKLFSVFQYCSVDLVCFSNKIKEFIPFLCNIPSYRIHVIITHAYIFMIIEKNNLNKNMKNIAQFSTLSYLWNLSNNHEIFCMNK